MNKSLPFLLTFVFLCTARHDMNAQWVKATNGLPPADSSMGWEVAWAIDAVGQSTAVVGLSRGGVFRTTDGGANWKSLGFSHSYHAELVDLSMVDSSHIWVAGGYSGAIYATSNGGQTWNVQFYDTTKTDFINYIRMFDPQNGVAMGDAVGNGPPLFLRTTDAGLHWVSMNDTALRGCASGDTWRRLDFVN